MADALIPTEKRVPVTAIVDGEFCGEECPFIRTLTETGQVEKRTSAEHNCNLFDMLLKGRVQSERCRPCLEMEYCI